MVVCPFLAFAIVKNQQWLIDEYGEGKTNALAAVAAVAAVQFTIMIIVVVKYWEDFMIVVRGQGHLPYDKSLTEKAEYLQSEQYRKDIMKDEERKNKRKDIIQLAKKKTEAE